MFLSTRRRLAFWYTMVTAIVLLLFASGVYLYVRTTLIERIDDTLNHVIEVVKRGLVIELSDRNKLQVNVMDSFPNYAQQVEDDHIDIEWFDDHKLLLWSTLSEGLNIPLHINPNGETVEVSSDHLLRQITQEVQIGKRIVGYVRVSHPWFEVAKPSRELIIELSLGIGLMVMSVGAIGWFLSGLAIEPIINSYQRLKQFTADASHELRNPIAMIQTNVQVALADPNPNAISQHQQLRVIERLTKRLSRLVEDLLFLARADKSEIKLNQDEIPLDALLMEVIEEQQIWAKTKGIALVLDLTGSDFGDSFNLVGNWDQLQRLFTNLIGNAIQYTSSGSVVVELARFDSSLQVKVTDTGMGIPPDAIGHLFERFYRVDPARSYPSDSTGSGSGLGLAIAQTIVEHHQGKIQIDSTVNQGTTVLVTFGIINK